jgi:hypothetical protein
LSEWRVEKRPKRVLTVGSARVTGGGESSQYADNYEYAPSRGVTGASHYCEPRFLPDVRYLLIADP